MAYDPDFDVDAIIRIIGTINEKYLDGSPKMSPPHRRGRAGLPARGPGAGCVSRVRS